MPNYCVAVGCKNTAKKGSEYSFHCFPHQNPNLLKKWVHVIRRKQWKPTKHSFICSDHFHESCFVIRPGAEGRRLKDDAVPSIFQTFPFYYQKDIKLRRSSRKRQYLTHEVVAPSEVEPSTSGPSPSELQVEHSYFGKKLHVLQQTVRRFMICGDTPTHHWLYGWMGVFISGIMLNQ